MTTVLGESHCSCKASTKPSISLAAISHQQATKDKQFIIRPLQFLHLKLSHKAYNVQSPSLLSLSTSTSIIPSRRISTLITPPPPQVSNPNLRRSPSSLSHRSRIRIRNTLHLTLLPVLPITSSARILLLCPPLEKYSHSTSRTSAPSRPVARLASACHPSGFDGRRARRLRGICCSCCENRGLALGDEGGVIGMGEVAYVRPDAFHANAIVCDGCVRWCGGWSCGFAGSKLLRSSKTEIARCRLGHVKQLVELSPDYYFFGRRDWVFCFEFLSLQFDF